MKKVILILVLLILISGCAEKSITGVEWFQEGNIQDIIKLQPRQSKELEDNRIGQMMRADIYREDEVDDFVHHNTDLGLKRVRLTIDWFDWDEVEDTGEYSKFEIGPYQDKAITELVNNGIKVKYTLVFWDEEIQIETEEGEEEYSRFKTEEEIERYLDYVRFIVGHFKDKIEYYEILNEQNHCEGTQQNVKLDDYVNLVKRVVPVIREEDPNAKIAAGSVSDLRQTEPREYFLEFIKSDVMPLVDGISFHPMYGVSPEHDILRQYYQDYSSFMQEIKNIASANGFEGEYMADELIWRTPINPHPDEIWTYSETKATKYYARGIVMNLGMDFTTGLALESLEELPLMVGAIRNLCTAMAGAKPIELPIEIQSEATNIKSYSFSLSNGDKLIALWTDGVAVDDDPGVKADLIFDGFSGKEITAIDVLNGYQQQIITSTENGNLVIQNLLVRDYPLILRII
ncbi:MAG: family 1 glycosylhydrolase [Nanoarchaeota archaeon]|nr:family 1 glycosylhydrolase [Nanoarchaeota archaeon]